MDRPSKKLSEKYIGLFRISQVIGPVTYRLNLPPSMKDPQRFSHKPAPCRSYGPTPESAPNRDCTRSAGTRTLGGQRMDD